MSHDPFKIVIGNNWQTSFLDDRESFGFPSSGKKETLDFSRVRDVVDIFVGGTSISGHIEEDSIFFLVRDFLFAVEKLSYGDGSVRVSFYEGPWELVLQRVGKKVYITLYRGGQRSEVVVKDQAVLFSHLSEGVLASAESLYQQAVELNDQAKDDPVVFGMNEIWARVKAILENSQVLNDEEPVQPRTVESTRWLSARTPDSFSFGFKFKAGITDLLITQKPLGSDLNPLLFKGRLAVHARGSRIVLGNGYLFLQAERLLASLRYLMTAWNEGRSMSRRLVSDGLIVGIRLNRSGLAVTLMDSHNDQAIIVMNDITPLDYAEAVLGVCRELRRLVIEQNPHQRRNLRIESFSREVRTITSWVKQNKLCGVVNNNPERYRNFYESSRIQTSAVDLKGAERLRFSERWRVEVEGLNIKRTSLMGKVVVVTARNMLVGVDTETGGVLWRRENDSGESRCVSAGADALVRASTSGTVEMLDLFTGVRRWHTSLTPRSGGSAVLLVIDHGPCPGVVVVAEEENKITALDLRTGEPRWRFTNSRGGFLALLRFGRLMYVCGNDGHICAVDIEDGSLVWRFTERTRFFHHPAVTNNYLVAASGRPSRSEGQLFGIDPFSGELKWRLYLEGGADTAPIISGDVALIPVQTSDCQDLLAVDISQGKILWRKTWDLSGAKCALKALEDSFVINTEGGVLECIDAYSGKQKWHEILGPVCSDDVPHDLYMVQRGGLLFVPADTVYLVRPEDGRVIHSLGGEPPVPDLLQVDQDLGVFIAEKSGHIAMYDLAGSLSVVS